MEKELFPHLFRTEFGKITSVLAKHFSLEHIEIAEDIASETFLLAMETWPYKGIPENPTAWLYTVAKNKTKNFIHRTKILEKVQNQLLPSLEKVNYGEIDLSDENIQDSQLKILFALCHPSIAGESQVALCLRVLCGFGIEEIATAFLSNKETINKRLVRAKEKLRSEKISTDLPDLQNLIKRLDNVLTTLYLLFSEGYYSETHESIVREDLCEEAIRLARILVTWEPTNTPAANALLALMYFQASRLKARICHNGELVLYENQDDSSWNYEYISLGAYHLNLASKGNELTKYHLEAGIAYWHTIKLDSKEKWESILQLYNRLLQIDYSPIVALNRTYALSKANSIPEAIDAAKKLHLTSNPYYFTLLGELHRQINNGDARSYFQEALRVTKSAAEKTLIQKKIDSLKALNPQGT
jgi:RNA polymerase sigma-70 factor (ECF subfamily)